MDADTPSPEPADELSDLRARTAQQAAAARFGQRALKGEPIGDLLDAAAALIAATLGVPFAKVLELQPDGESLLLRAGAGWREGLVGSLVIGAHEDSQAGYTLRSAGPVIVADLAAETRFRGPPLLHEHGVVSGISVVIAGRERPYGVLGAHTTAPRSFSSDDTDFLQVIANILSAAIVRAQAEAERLELERQLLEAQKVESLGVLAGGIAHDFNNLLTSILGNAALALLELAPESPARDSLARIELTARRASDLTRQLLAYAGRGQARTQRLSMNALIGEMAHLFQVSIPRNVVIRLNLAEDLAAVEADATQLRQVIMNLVINGAEAIGTRSGVITLTTGVMWVDQAYLRTTYAAPDLAEGSYVYAEVSDTGVGMDAATQARIFEPFYTTKVTGRGLGLAAVLGITRRHRGALKVYSEPGRGTTFKLLLPALLSAADPAAEKAVLDNGWRGHGTALVIDDEEELRAVTSRMLERLGFTVLSAGDGRAGVEVFRANADAVTLVLLDMALPLLSGVDAFRELRRIRADVKVVLMSGYAEDDAMASFAGKGLVGFLHKPFAPGDLQRVLGAAFAAPQLGAPGPRRLTPR